ncbi:MAG: toll/interleukin-1 receptor domain-containing protein [Gammaproteobacteria bacterium]|nr:toll/interleukin-1 receptor domain-containing protein [Gammaproteobacteria bacterium]
MSKNLNYKHDVFISYSSKDRPWVQEFIKRIEDQKIKVCIDYRDFIPGMASIKNIENAVINSYKTLLILTNNYFESGWLEFENILLQTLDPTNQKLRLIPILKERCELPLRLKTLTYLNFADPEDEELEWKRLIRTINKQRSISVFHNFFSYDEAWVGRERIIGNLINKVNDGSCRLLVLLGIAGIGKTALGEKLAVELKDWLYDWNGYLQLNFDNEEETSDFCSFATKLLERCGEVVSKNDRNDTKQLMHHLAIHLRENRYLIQIDSLENLLQGNEEKGWSEFKDEWWVKFFQTWLNSDTCQSCFILTSQDLPAQIHTMGTRYQNFWDYRVLTGLDKSEQLNLFNKIGLNISEISKGILYLERIGQAYDGHPLALRVIAGEISNHPFNGDVIRYWAKYGKEFEEIERAIEEAATKGITVSADDQFNLHCYTRNLHRNVKSRLDKVFNRLKETVREAYLLLCESSLYRCEVSEDFWLSHLEDWDIDKDRQEMALDALRDRYLVEERVDEDNNYLLRQHNLIRGVSLQHLRKLR